MIEFDYKLPSMYIHGYENQNGTYNNHELGFPSVMTTTDPKLGLFIKRLRNCINCERALVFIGRACRTILKFLIHIVKLSSKIVFQVA